MATTTNFGWQTPDDSDLVKDGAAAIRTLGSAIDTSLIDLKGGTTDQVLAKNSNTDMDFKWVTSDDADAIQNAIVDAKGDLIAASAADTPARLAVGTNEHRLVAASGETTGLKYVADTTNYAIAAKGDLLVGTAADTLAALSVGTNGYTLVANSSTSTGLEWVAPAGGGKVLQVVSTFKDDAYTTSPNVPNFTDVTGLSVSITPSSTNSKILVMVDISGGSEAGVSGAFFRLMRDSTVIAAGASAGNRLLGFGRNEQSSNNDWIEQKSVTFLDSPASTSSLTYKVQVTCGGVLYINRSQADNNASYAMRVGSSITVLEIGA